MYNSVLLHCYRVKVSINKINFIVEKTSEPMERIRAKITWKDKHSIIIKTIMKTNPEQKREITKSDVIGNKSQELNRESFLGYTVNINVQAIVLLLRYFSCYFGTSHAT